jgi:hypothetical protein
MYQKPEIQTNVVKPKMFTNFNNEEFRILSIEMENALDAAVKDVITFMAYNIGVDKTEEEKDYLYGEAKRLWENYVRVLRDSKLTLYLNTEQFDYFTKILKEEIEYDVNTIFFGIDLTNTLGSWFKQVIESEVEISSYQTDPVSFNYIDHLISTVKVKGLTEESYLFAQVLRKIKEIMKVVNFYDGHAKNLSKDIQEWVANFEQNKMAY